MRNPVDLAWAAGLFEGEGCFSFQGSKVARTRGGRLATAKLSMTDEDIVRKFHIIMGFGSVSGPFIYGTKKDGTPNKPQWRWTAYSFEHVQATVALFYPWLGIRRRARAIEVLNEHKKLFWRSPSRAIVWAMYKKPVSSLTVKEHRIYGNIVSSHYRLKNPEKVQTSNHLWRSNNLEKARAATRRWRANEEKGG